MPANYLQFKFLFGGLKLELLRAEFGTSIEFKFLFSGLKPGQINQLNPS